VTKPSTFVLIRHGESEGIYERLAGRSAGFGLSVAGLEQAHLTGEHVARKLKIRCIYSSPRQRARETAAILARHCGCEVDVNDAFDECEYGDWTGRKFSDLDQFEEWRTFNAFRSAVAAPGGESVRDVQYRAVTEILRIRAALDGQATAVVTHADVIRSIVTYFAGVPLDLLLRFTIDPASVTVIELAENQCRIQCVNQTTK
jgi:broad specificity phosphatase PhoE